MIDIDLKSLKQMNSDELNRLSEEIGRAHV